ncbi:MAG: DUF2141 domain-containing protein [Pseudomonadota bacterium]
MAVPFAFALVTVPAAPVQANESVAAAEASVVSAPTGQLEIAVDGTTAGVGTVRVNLYASEGSFLKQEDVQAEVAVPDEGASQVVFDDLAPGKYAVVAYQDLNGNGELDRGLFGIPLEPIGFSNGAVPVFSAPEFEDAAVSVADGATAIEITVRNLTSARRAGS